jgi:Xaa-Pro dipeptidase
MFEFVDKKGIMSQSVEMINRRCIVMSLFIQRRKEFINGNLQGLQQAVLITSPKNIYYLTGFYSDPHERFMGLLWQEKTGWTLILPRLDLQAAQEAVQGEIDLIGFGDDEPAQAKLRNWLTQSNYIEEIWIEQDIITYERWQWILEASPTVKMRNITPVIEQMRVIKTEEEVTKLQLVSSTTDQVLKLAMASFRRGMTENDLVAEIEYQAKKAGAEQMSFGTTVLGGEKSALPHGNAGSRKLEQGVLLIDFGLVMDGYCSDMTRTFHIGPWEEKMKLVYETVLDAEKRAIKEVKLGMTFSQVDRISRSSIEKTGYGDYFIHRLGHGLGLDVHEYPSVSSMNQEEVKEGMVFTIEPGIYIPGQGGVRIEDAVVMKPDGAVSLTSYPKEVDEVVIE